MLRKSKLYFSAMLAALVLTSLLFTSSVSACEEEPQTFLSLFMNSDLIVIAKYNSNGKPVKSNEDQYGYTLDTERKLLVSKVYKGQQDLKTASFLFTDYVSKEKQSNSESEEGHTAAHSFDVSKIKIGGEYLFFLTKDKETGKYYVTDYVSGVRETNKNLALYEQNLSELKQIVSAKENQYELLTEWIVKSIEKPETRDDGISDLAESFNGLTYQDEDPNYKGKGPFVVVDGYGVYTVGVAKRLTASQKERVTKVLYSTLQESWLAATPNYGPYGISAILGGIDKPRLALYTYNFLQEAGKSNSARKNIVMEFLNETLADETYSTVYYEMLDIGYKIDEAKKDKSAKGKQTIKDLSATREAKLVALDKRFKFMQDRNFVAVAVASK